jgi:CelD/BcsL family acetyltransferase involved in cellulose biosynthesis
LQQRRDIPAFRLTLGKTREQGSVEAALSRNSRQQLRRAMRSYGPCGALSLDVAETPEQAVFYFEHLKALHIDSWTRRGKAHAFRYPFFETFHRALIARGVAEGCVRLICVRAGSEPIGYLYNFRHGGIEYAYQSGFEDSDPEKRPGYVCHALAIENAAVSGVEVYDFLAGANRLKQSFANETYRMSWATLTRPTTSLRAAAALGATARAIKTRLQG